MKLTPYCLGMCYCRCMDLVLKCLILYQEEVEYPRIGGRGSYLYRAGYPFFSLAVYGKQPRRDIMSHY